MTAELKEKVFVTGGESGWGKVKRYGKLRRHFEADDFDVRLCLYYIYKYIDEVGIQQYLVDRLRRRIGVAREVRESVLELVHMTIVKPDSTNAIKELLFELAIRNRHTAVEMYWIVQSYTVGLSKQPNSKKFKSSLRLNNKLQQILFNRERIELLGNGKKEVIRVMLRELQEESPLTVNTESSKNRWNRWKGRLFMEKIKVKENVEAAFVGMSAIAASVGGHEQLVGKIGEMAYLEGKYSKIGAKTGKEIHIRESHSSAQIRDMAAAREQGSVVKDRKRMTGLGEHVYRLVKGQRASDENKIGMFIEETGLASKKKLLKDRQYFMDTIMLVTKFNEISSRLLKMNKDERQLGLKAELRIMNEILSKNTGCISQFCEHGKGDDEEREEGHMRIVRIPVEDAVVLNSAEHAPYLMFVEVLEQKNEEKCEEEGREKSVDLGASGKGRSSSGTVDQPKVDEEQRLQELKKIKQEEKEVQERITTAVMLLVQLNKQRQIVGNNITTTETEKHSVYSGGVGMDRKVGTSTRSSTPNSHSEKPESEKGGYYSRKLSDYLPIRIEKTSEDNAVGKLERTSTTITKVVDSSKIMDTIRKRILDEIEVLEKQKLKIKRKLYKLEGANAQEVEELEQFVTDGKSSDEFEEDLSSKVLSEDFKAKKQRIKNTSPYGNHKNWNLYSIIVKEGGDLRQEMMAIRAINILQDIFKKENVDIYLQSYKIIATGSNAGLIQTITNSNSIHSIKKKTANLYTHFIKTYGTPDTSTYKRAQLNFMRSLAGYSILTYLMLLKDRHNGNILLLSSGHIVHIDFGFMFNNSPGNLGFETAPFKLTSEYLWILGVTNTNYSVNNTNTNSNTNSNSNPNPNPNPNPNLNSNPNPNSDLSPNSDSIDFSGSNNAIFLEFRQLLIDAFIAIRKHWQSILYLIEILSFDSDFECFISSANTNSTSSNPNLNKTTAIPDPAPPTPMVNGSASNTSPAHGVRSPAKNSTVLPGPANPVQPTPTSTSTSTSTPTPTPTPNPNTISPGKIKEALTSPKKTSNHLSKDEKGHNPSNYPNNIDNSLLISNLKSRLMLHTPISEIEGSVDKLISQSVDAISTKLYDTYQYYSNGILY